MRQGRGGKEASASGAGAEGDLGEGLQGLREPPELVTAFRYPGQVLMTLDDDWIAVVGNLVKARKSLGRLSRILSREEADPKVSGHFYKVVLQEVLLYGVETWVIIHRIEQALYSFQHRIARQLTRRKPRRRGGGSWA